ncbi:MAG TPA: sigma-54 dependent transcriptional regulator [bacterium]|jgi:NtrC-family two-component system response regulator AlgB
MRIFVVDDERNIRKTLGILLETEGHSVVAVSNVDDAVAEAGRGAFDLAFVDLRLGVDSGLDLIPKLLAVQPWLKIIVITAYASIDTAVEAIKRGATDYIPKPFTPAQIQILLQRVADFRRLEQKVETLQETLSQLHPEVDLTTAHIGMQQSLSLAKEAASANVTVLIRGESGTGKSLLARLIHQWSPRHDRPFAVVSCPSLPAELLESELFGHKKGAFTGAVKDSPGRIASCEGGTLFLDEIGDLPLPLQPKLLRFLQDHEYERIGEAVTRKADVRIIAATSVNLQDAVRDSRFRQELYYRLNTFEITIPPLRERREDIPILAEHFLAFLAAQNHRNCSGFTDGALQILESHDWPGNVRELRNAVERAVILCHGPQVGTEHLPPNLAPAANGVEIGDLVPIEKIEEAHIRRILAKAKSLEEAAQILGIDTATLWRRRKQYDI